MYDIRQFKPALYFLLFIGMTGFALAVEAPGLWLLSISVLGLHGWLVRTRRFRPFPRLLANLITLVALLYTFQALRPAVSPGSTPIITIGQFLVFLQMVKLFELRANRDYAQLLVLSLLLMVAGAISTSSLAFGILLIVHLTVSLYVCLLFHLKVENENAGRAQAVPRDKLNDATLKQDQRYLGRSMRRLAALVSVVGVSMAVLVFLFFPRGPGAGMFGQLQFQRPALTGFSEDAGLGDIRRISQNDEIVAQVQFRRNGQLIEGTQPLLLRGRTFDRYDPVLRKWEHNEAETGRGGLEAETGPSPSYETRGAAFYAGDVLQLDVALRPTGITTLFTLPGLLGFRPSRNLGRIHYSAVDDTLSSAENIYQRLDYQIRARDTTVKTNVVYRIEEGLTRINQFNQPPPVIAEPDDAHRIPAPIAQYALRPEVSGVDQQGRPLASLRAPGLPGALDWQIATNIETHLRSNFNYTLDLTGEKVDPDKDRVVQFLYDWKKGHCEYFASAMVLMCQSLGMQARYVTGFRSEEYDGSLGHYYVVRQSHAHAWVEVKTPDGWQTFDPTSGNDIDSAASRTAWQSVKHFFDWLEFKWAEKVVAYDSDRRDSLIFNLEHRVADAAVNEKLNPRSISRSLRDWWDAVLRRIRGWFETDGLTPSEIVTVSLLCAVAVITFWWLIRTLRQRLRIRRRAAKIGLDSLPTTEQIRLARQLGFYERLTILLERHQIIRPRNLTPAEFSDTLAFLPNEAYDAIRRLTKIFYSIRFGRRELDHEEQKDLESTVQSLEPILNPSTAPGRS
jgi:hypothetical protein